MTDDPHILICASCSNPFRVSIEVAGTAPSVVDCPYCQSSNACTLGGALKSQPIEPQNQTYFWNTETRRDVECGVHNDPLGKQRAPGEE